MNRKMFISSMGVEILLVISLLAYVKTRDLQPGSVVGTEMEFVPECSGETEEDLWVETFVDNGEIIKEDEAKSFRTLNGVEVKEYEVYMLAMAEAENQDTVGKALVMLVVLNRVNSSQFPDSVEKVIFQNNQFSPISNGRYDKVIPDDDCWNALNLVQSGWNESQGALYFDSENISTWHEDNLKFLFKHQDHCFYMEGSNK